MKKLFFIMKKLFFQMKFIRKPLEFAFSVALGHRICIFSCLLVQIWLEFAFSVAILIGICIFSWCFGERAIKSYVFAFSAHAFSDPHNVNVRKP